MASSLRSHPFGRGRPGGFISLRIGWMTDDPVAADADLLHAMWLSEDDCVEVVRCAIEGGAPAPENWPEDS